MVACGDDGTCRFYDGTSYTEVGRVSGVDGTIYVDAVPLLSLTDATTLLGTHNAQNAAAAVAVAVATTCTTR